MNKSKITVIYHSADCDGIFCREIARKFMPDAELIGWNFGDKLLDFPAEGVLYILDLAFDCISASSLPDDWKKRVIWIDHHKSSIEKWNDDLPGYRIDGVAACRLAWQWFSDDSIARGVMSDSCYLPRKEDFYNRSVKEPWAVRLAGEYDIWDKRDSDAELFQHGLKSEELTPHSWISLLDSDAMSGLVIRLLNQGRALQWAKEKENESIIKSAGFDLDFEGLHFLACNHARYNSFLFTAGLKPEHDACLGFAWRGGKWTASLYHAPGKEHHDLSLIAVKHGGGGHKGACGFTCESLPFALPVACAWTACCAGVVP
jgi:uncharacterized protein